MASDHPLSNAGTGDVSGCTASSCVCDNRLCGFQHAGRTKVCHKRSPATAFDRTSVRCFCCSQPRVGHSPVRRRRQTSLRSERRGFTIASRGSNSGMLVKKSIPVVLAVIILWGLVSRSPDLSANVSKRDFIAYWAAGRLLIQHQNPYDRGAVLDLERQQAFTERNALILRTPPWSLFIMLPLGLMNAYWGWLFWIAISIASLVMAVRLCWN